MREREFRYFERALGWERAHLAPPPELKRRSGAEGAFEGVLAANRGRDPDEDGFWAAPLPTSLRPR